MIAGPGMGDTGGVVPVSMEDAVEVGQQEWPRNPAVRVLSFTEKQLIDTFKQQNWELREVHEVYEFLRAVKHASHMEPQGIRAQPLTQESWWKQRYPLWFVPFKAGQLFACKRTWENVFQRFGVPLPGKLRKWLADGFSVWLNVKKFGKQPGINRLTPQELEFALHQVEEWVDMGALDEVEKPPDHVRVCNVVVAYRSGKMDRVCWAGNAINEGVKADPFRMESLQTVIRVMQKGDWMFSFDLKKGYFQVPLKEGFRKFTYMRIGDKYFRWNVLMFGLASAPRDFSFIIKQVLGLLRKQGFRCCFFIDDIIFFAASKEEAERDRLRALDTFYELGFRVSWPKSLLQPGKLIRHLGLDVCSVDGSVWAPEDKVVRVKTLAIELLKRGAGLVPGREVATIVGVLEVVAPSDTCSTDTISGTDENIGATACAL